ncbi:Rhomboid protein 1, mitochondrial [Cytospora mali]|uniref:Rhomboid protein 1, mitochondrial n=1 Tax=Cytospora mali TaxID=578113 RepID=A0A194VDH9_CYTMA|nr:Rhomboid protein 1, mitochondrial [Valsa mali var. pyri (nom. inval.)]
MATSRVAKGLLWGTIGANIYVFGKWHIIPDPQAAKQGPQSVAYQQAKANHLRYMHENYTLSRKNVAEGRWWTLITSAFSHSDLLHLGVNMMVLNTTASLGFSYLIGLGPLRMGTLALGSALCGSLGSLYDYRKAAEAGLPESSGLGASAMVEGVMVATMLAVPKLPMQLFPIPITMPYWVLVGGFVGYDMYRLYEQRTSGQLKQNWMGAYVGYAAHLGGAAFGAAFYFLAMRRGMVVRREAIKRFMQR